MTKQDLIDEHRRTTPVMDQKEIDNLKEILDGDNRVLAEECRKLINSLEIARHDAGAYLKQLEIEKAVSVVAYREVVRLQEHNKSLRDCINIAWAKLKNIFTRSE